MVGGTVTKPAAPHPHPAIGQQQRHRMIVARHGDVSHRAPLPASRVPDFRGQDGAEIAKFKAVDGATDHQHLAVGQDNTIVKFAGIDHGAGGLFRRCRAGEINYRGFAGAIETGIWATRTAGNEQLAFVKHDDCAIFGIPTVGQTGEADAAGAGGVEPVHAIGRAAMKEPAIGRQMEIG